MEYAFYQVLQPFIPAPNDKNALAVQKDDVLLISVQSPFLESSSHRKGWLYAYNRCTGTEGYVPDTIIQSFSIPTYIEGYFTKNPYNPTSCVPENM